MGAVTGVATGRYLPSAGRPVVRRLHGRALPEVARIAEHLRVQAGEVILREGVSAVSSS